MRTDIKSEVNIIKNIATNIIILLTSSIVVVYVHSKLSVNHCSISLRVNLVWEVVKVKYPMMNKDLIHTTPSVRTAI